jgi:anti-anti-sigma regulatory factor
MLRVEFKDAANTLTLRMEGRLVGTFAEEVRKLVARSTLPRRLVVDMSEVTFVDTAGEQVLAWLARVGAEFVAESSYPRHVCDGLHLPVA